MKNLSPEQVATKWSNGLANARDSITAGVNGVSVAPGQAAAANKAAYLAGVQANVDKFAQRAAAVPLQAWKDDMLSKGLDRIAPGAVAAQPKMATFMAKLLPYQKAGVSSLPARGSLAQNQQRMIAWMNYMVQFKK